MERFSVDVYKNGKLVRVEDIETIGELKNYLYSLRETKGGITGKVFDRFKGYALIKQPSGVATIAGSCSDDVDFLNRLKKAAYA
jgi:hypothetical protein